MKTFRGAATGCLRRKCMMYNICFMVTNCIRISKLMIYSLRSAVVESFLFSTEIKKEMYSVLNKQIINQERGKSRENKESENVLLFAKRGNDSTTMERPKMETMTLLPWNGGSNILLFSYFRSWFPLQSHIMLNLISIHQL